MGIQGDPAQLFFVFDMRAPCIRSLIDLSFLRAVADPAPARSTVVPP